MTRQMLLVSLFRLVWVATIQRKPMRNHHHTAMAELENHPTRSPLRACATGHFCGRKQC
jgi:hypothetical protein